MAWFMHHDIMKAIEVVMGVAQFVIINWKSLYPWQLILVIYPLLCCGEPSKDPYFDFHRSNVGRIWAWQSYKCDYGGFNDRRGHAKKVDY